MSKISIQASIPFVTSIRRDAGFYNREQTKYVSIEMSSLERMNKGLIALKECKENVRKRLEQETHFLCNLENKSTRFKDYKKTQQYHYTAGRVKKLKREIVEIDQKAQKLIVVIKEEERRIIKQQVIEEMESFASERGWEYVDDILYDEFGNQVDMQGNILVPYKDAV